MDRKKFITSASVMAIASLSHSKLFNAAINQHEQLLPIVDTHQHLWDIERFAQGWSVPPISGNFGMQEYRVAIKGLNVVKSVYMEVAVPPGKRHEEALYAIELCRKRSNPMVAAIIAVDPNMKEFEKYMSEFKDSPYIKGIRYFFKSAEEILNDQVIKNIGILGAMNMHFEFSIPQGWLPQMSELVSLCPDTGFIVQHCGNADPKAFYGPWGKLLTKPEFYREQWITNMKAIASKKNVGCKISGIVSLVPGDQLTEDTLAPVINQCLDIFGPDRVMFAGDWPVCLKKTKLRNWIGILKRVVINRPYEDQKKLFYDNAVKYYKI